MFLKLGVNLELFFFFLINLQFHFSFQRSEPVKVATNQFICFDSRNPDIVNDAHSIH